MPLGTRAQAAKAPRLSAAARLLAALLGDVRRGVSASASKAADPPACCRASPVPHPLWRNNTANEVPLRPVSGPPFFARSLLERHLRRHRGGDRRRRSLQVGVAQAAAPAIDAACSGSSLAIIVVFGGADAAAAATRRSSSGSRRCSTGCSPRCSPARQLLFRRNLIRSACSQRDCSMPDRGLGEAQPELGRLLRLHGRGEPLRRASTSGLRRPWVNFKLFGGMGLMLLFVVAQALFPDAPCEEEPEPRKAMSVAEDDPQRASARSSRSALELVDESAQHARPLRRGARRQHALAPRRSCQPHSPASQHGGAPPHGLPCARRTDAAPDPRARASTAQRAPGRELTITAPDLRKESNE